MINFRVIARVFSLVLIVEGLFMLISSAVSYMYGEETATRLLLSGVITVVTGVLVFTPLRKEEKLSGYKEGYIIITGIWLILSLFGTIPYLLTGTIRIFTDAFFESMSGFTTTGATVLTDIGNIPKGILFWRSITQWIGGIGFILISLSLIPVVRSVNVQLTLTDFTGQTTDKINPRVSGSAKRIIMLFTIFTLAEALLLTISGMPLFDAVCNSFSTMSTGGFSTGDNSMFSMGSPAVLIILTVFMFIAGINKSNIYFAAKSDFRKAFGNLEFIFFALTFAAFSIIVSSALMAKDGVTAGQAVREGTFQVISLITTTGFYHSDYNHWGGFLILILFILMFMGGTSGSAGGSLKFIRLLVITKNSRHEMRRMIHPNAYLPVRMDNKIIPHSIVHNVLIFIILYVMTISVSALVISLLGYDIVTSFSTSAALLGNIGPGIGSLGPFSTYASVPEAGKWFFTFLMFLGRLELLSVLTFFTRDFYRK